MLGAKEESTRRRSIAVSTLTTHINALSSLVLILYTVKSLQMIINLDREVLV
jgi:hypothetical protein